VPSHGPLRPAARPSRSATLYGRRRRRATLGAALAVILAAVAFAAPRHLPGAAGGGSVAGADGGSSAATDDGRATPVDPTEAAYVSTEGWPRRGQGAYVLGDGRPAVSPDQEPVPIASVAKVMTAYLVLRHHPLDAGDDGPSFVVTDADVDDTDARRHQGQSIVPVRAGEELTERQALTAILLPSANNIAVLVARQVSGSVPAFVAEMNRTARSLGMARTTYTDPSGFDDGTVSTAVDQLRLARVVARDETLAAMMATRSDRLPVAGVVTNTNTLLGRDGFVGMKTGSDSAAGGCFMFRAVVHTASGDATLIGVVLGQRGHSLINAGLVAARRLVDRLGGGGAPGGLPPQQ
jgi:D-alanyl-D-alanine carboxypeptidase (penicillin-binding protein 5/6)